MANREAYDVVILGGGPAGSTAAGFLARAGRDVLVVEKERFPRYHIGESMLSATIPLLDELGVLEKVGAAGFIEKPGGTFVWGRRSEPWSFVFRDDPGGWPHAWHVVRSRFDEILLRHAADEGATVEEGSRVNDVRYGSDSSTVTIESDGRSRDVDARWVVDATGQNALLGRRDGLREFDPFFRNLAIWSYWRGAEALDGENAGNILSVAFADGWFWFIPLDDGTTSVGAVIDVERFAEKSAKDPERVYAELVGACPEIAQRLRAAERAAPVRTIRDYSYASSRFWGPGYLLAGDAACFIDPVFSTGVHLACLSGYLAARALGPILDGGDAGAALGEYDARYRAAFERYREFLYFFYDHHADPESYFWSARKVLREDSGLDARTAFVRLMSGRADVGELLEGLHEKMETATQEGRFAAVPGSDVFRARTTRREMKDPKS